MSIKHSSLYMLEWNALCSPARAIPSLMRQTPCSAPQLPRPLQPPVRCAGIPCPLAGMSQEAPALPLAASVSTETHGEVRLQLGLRCNKTVWCTCDRVAQRHKSAEVHARPCVQQLRSGSSWAIQRHPLHASKKVKGERESEISR